MKVELTNVKAEDRSEVAATIINSINELSRFIYGKVQNTGELWGKTIGELWAIHDEMSNYMKQIL